MLLRTTLLLCLFATLLPSCGRTQNADPNSGAAAQTARDTSGTAARLQNLQKVLNTVRESMNSTKDTVEADRLANAAYATTKVLATLARAWDLDGSWKQIIDGKEQEFIREDATRAGRSGKIVNGMLGVHDMFQTMYGMRYANRADRMLTLDTMSNTIQRLMKERADGATLLGQLADDCFHLSKAVFLDLDKDSVFAGHIDQVDQVYAEGRGAAETGEDLFLNGMYRTFEVCQVWAFSLDVTKRNQVKQIYSSMISRTSAREGIGHQMATAMEHFYRIVDYIAATIIASGR